jgi:hypothetical protein
MTGVLPGRFEYRQSKPANDRVARKLLKLLGTMSRTGQPSVSGSTARRPRSAKGKRKGRPKGKASAGAQADTEREMAAVGSLTRTKALLLAALRVWELKHRIRD